MLTICPPWKAVIVVFISIAHGPDILSILIHPYIHSRRAQYFTPVLQPNREEKDFLLITSENGKRTYVQNLTKFFPKPTPLSPPFTVAGH